MVEKAKGPQRKKVCSSVYGLRRNRQLSAFYPSEISLALLQGQFPGCPVPPEMPCKHWGLLGPRN